MMLWVQLQYYLQHNFSYNVMTNTCFTVCNSFSTCQENISFISLLRLPNMPFSLHHFSILTLRNRVIYRPDYMNRLTLLLYTLSKTPFSLVVMSYLFNITEFIPNESHMSVIHPLTFVIKKLSVGIN